MKTALKFVLLSLLGVIVGHYESAAAQTIYMKTTSSSVSGYNIIDGGRGAGSSATAATATLVASGTLIQAGTTLKWISPPLVSGLTISGTITVNLWAKESATSSNAGISVRLYKYSGGTESGTPFATCVYGTELTTTMAAKNYPCTPTSTAFSAGDQIVAKVFFVNCATSGCPTGTMASGTGTFDYNRSSAADGESYVTFTETPAFAQSFAPTLAATTSMTPQFATSESMAAAVSTDMVPTFAKGFSFAPSFAIATQADVTATFDLVAALGPSLSVSATPNLATTQAAQALSVSTTMTPTFSKGTGVAPTLASTVDATVQQGVGQTIPVSVSSSMSVQQAVTQTVSASLTTTMTPQNAVGWNPSASVAVSMVPTFNFSAGSPTFSFAPSFAVTTQADVTATFDLTGPTLAVATDMLPTFQFTGGSSAYSMSPTLSFSALMQVAFDATNSATSEVVSLAMLPTFTVGRYLSPSLSSTVAMTPTFATSQTASLTVATAMTPQNSVGWTIPIGVTTAMSPSLVKNGGSSSYSISPTLSLTALMNALLTTAETTTTNIGTAFTASLQVGRNLITTADVNTNAVASLATTKTVSASASVAMTVTFTYTPGGIHPRRNVVMM